MDFLEAVNAKEIMTLHGIQYRLNCRVIEISSDKGKTWKQSENSLMWFFKQDWQIVGEKKTLSDEIMRARIDAKSGEVVLVYEEPQDSNDTDEPVITVEKAKKAIMAIMVWVTTEHAPEKDSGVVLENVKKIVGERLLK